MGTGVEMGVGMAGLKKRVGPVGVRVAACSIHACLLAFQTKHVILIVESQHH